MSDHTYIVDLCDNTFELENLSSRFEENNESDVGDFVDTLDELIITCVQSYPHLYNKGNKNYKDNMMKEKSWEEIAKTCNISVIEVQQRWKRLKDRYSKQRRLNDRATRSGSAAQIIKQWPLFENMKFMEKHIQRRRTFSNVPLQSNIKPQDNASKKLNHHQNERENTPPFQVNIAQSIQELQKIQSIPESKQLKSQTQKMSPENPLKKSAHGSLRGWQNFEPTVTNTFQSSMGIQQPSMPLKSTCIFGVSGNSPRFAPFTAMHESFKSSSEISDHSQKNLSSNKLDKSHYSADEEVMAVKSSTTSPSSSSNISTKCFIGGTQRRKKNNRDPVETSFINVSDTFKEYLLEKKEEKKKDLSADEYLAKFIISRLLHIPEEERDEKRKKIIEILLTK